MSRKLFLIIMLTFIFIFFFISMEEVQNNIDKYSENYFVANTLNETGSANIVTGIYLDYRLFDSIFEASILLITVSGIILMSKKEKGTINDVTMTTYDKQTKELLNNSAITICIGRLLYPFMLIFGFYIILYGHLSPGGGFQGGVILATAILMTYLIDSEKINNIDMLVKLEKFVFIGILIISSISVITKGVFFTNFTKIDEPMEMKRLFLILLNLFIGLKVSLGLVSIFSTFIKEGRS